MMLPCHAGYFDAPAALACPWGQTSGAQLPSVCLVFCALEGAAAMKVRLYATCVHELVWASICLFKRVYMMPSAVPACLKRRHLPSNFYPRCNGEACCGCSCPSQSWLQASKASAYEAALNHYRDCVRAILCKLEGYECQVSKKGCDCWVDNCTCVPCVCGPSQCSACQSDAALVTCHLSVWTQGCVTCRKLMASSCWHSRTP